MRARGFSNAEEFNSIREHFKSMDKLYPEEAKRAAETVVWLYREAKISWRKLVIPCRVSG